MKRFNPFTSPVSLFIRFDGEDRKISIKSGQEAHFHEHHYHDEGWSSSSMSVTRRGNTLRLRRRTDGTDCDGRMSTYGEFTCHVSQRAAYRAWAPRGEKRPRVCYPRWEEVESNQRDYAAERMGY